MRIRPEAPGDEEGVRRVNELAFGGSDEAWMALALPAYDEKLRGTVRYPPAWGSA